MRRLFFPLIRKHEIHDFAMGVQIENGGFSRSIEYVAKGSWIKRRVNWSEVDERGWVKEDSDLGLAVDHPLLLTVHNAPLRYLVNPTYKCGAIRKDAWPAYVEFIISVIDRYQPRWIELWNEPDIASSPYPDLFGCWPEDGLSYANMANYVYKRVKAARPKVMIFSGALAQVGRFAAQLPQCDGVSYHSYPKLAGGTIGITSTKLKARQLRSMGHKNILCSETSVLGPGTPEHDDLQKYYFDYLSGLRGEIVGAFWYTLKGNGWEHSDMIEKDPKPVWYLYQTYHESRQ